jgi:hypothetical protein
LPNEKEEARAILADGTQVRIVNEYRRWGDYLRGLDEDGCPTCHTKLFDRLTHIYYGRAESHEVEYHINSGTDLHRLHDVEATRWNGHKVFVRGDKVEVE